MTDSSPLPPRRRSARRRFAPVAVVAGVLASAALATSMNGTLGAFVAQITNSNNSAANGVLTMSESGPNNNGGTGTTTCNSTDATGGVSSNSYSCSSINKYGASTTMVPGSSISTAVTITNTGTVTPTTFTLQPGVCQQSNNGTVNGSANDLCSKIMVKIVQTGVATPIVATTPLSTFGGSTGTPAAATTLTNLAPNASATYTFTITFPSTGSSASDNTYQGLKASQTLAWTFTS